MGAGSLVLKPVPNGATAVGSPAIIKCIDPKYVTEPVSENKTEIEPKIEIKEKDSSEKNNQPIGLKYFIQKCNFSSW